MERRQFIQQVAGTALVSATALSGSRLLGANDRVNIGLIGCGGRGRSDAALLRRFPDVNVVAVCDVYTPHAEAAQAWAGSGCRAYGDFRRLLEQRDIDAVLVATPDHWHAAITVLACQAGKDVYVEKPLAHTIRRGTENGGGGAPLQPRRADRHAAPVRPSLPPGGGDRPERTNRTRALCARVELPQYVSGRDRPGGRFRTRLRGSTGTSTSAPLPRFLSTRTAFW